MTNEELAALIQSGRDDLISILWAQVERFIAQQANRWNQAWNGRGGVTFEDLYQTGFLAMMNAVQSYDPGKGVKFITWLGICLKAPFLDAVRYRTPRQQKDPIETAVGLDTPIEDGEDITIGDMIADPTDHIADADRRLYLEQLHEAIENALDKLPPAESAVIRARFYGGLTREKTGSAIGTTADQVKRMEAHAMNTLRKPGRESARLRAFLDDRTPFYSLHGVHAVEWAVVKRERAAELADLK